MFNLIVSFPNDKLIEEISNQSSQLIETHSSIQIGATKFDLQKIIVFSYKNLMFPSKNNNLCTHIDENPPNKRSSGSWEATLYPIEQSIGGITIQ